MAHEIGHLLLATNEHSRKGLMQPHWGPSVIRDAITGGLGFTLGQRNKMRKRLASRHAASE